MTPERMNEWLGAVEYLMTNDEGCFVENDFGDCIKIGDMCGGRYEKFKRGSNFFEFCGTTDSAAEAVLWLYEQNKPMKAPQENDNAALEEEKRYKEFYKKHGKDGWGDEYS